MAFLFTLENNIAKPHAETLLIRPYKDIWERDTSKDKAKAIREFTYIELYTSKKKTNVYAGYEAEERQKVLTKMLFGDIPNWEPDMVILEGISKLEQFQTEASPSYAFLEAAETAANKLKSFSLHLILMKGIQEQVHLYILLKLSLVLLMTQNKILEHYIMYERKFNKNYMMLLKLEAIEKLIILKYNNTYNERIKIHN